MSKKLDLSGAAWRTSSLSGSNGQCVQVALIGEYVIVRDSKDPQGAVLAFGAAEWNAFLVNLKADHLPQ